MVRIHRNYYCKVKKKNEDKLENLYVKNLIKKSPEIKCSYKLSPSKPSNGIHLPKKKFPSLHELFLKLKAASGKDEKASFSL